MELKIFIKYTEGYLPTPRHRKLRYSNHESFETVSIKEISRTQTVLKFKVKDKEIVEYENCLYSKVLMTNNLFYCGNSPENEDNESILGRLKHSFIGYSTFFGFEPEDTRENMIKKAQSEADNYILIDGELWEKDYEPCYGLLTFGLGNNHAGIGTSLSVVCENIYTTCRTFKANERDFAIKKAIEVALDRGDTDSVEFIKKCPVIEIY